MVDPTAGQHPSDPPRTPTRALAELRAGNERFVTGTRIHPHQDTDHRAALAGTQQPFAVVLGCADSRVAPEIIFDRGLGDLFVVRAVGYTASRDALGSIEYAVSVLHTPLVVVLGHSSCGAVKAACASVRTGERPGGHLGDVVDSVAPSVRLAATRHIDDLDQIVELHVRRTVEELVGNSDVLARAVTAGQCAVVGMSYQLDKGEARELTR